MAQVIGYRATVFNCELYETGSVYAASSASPASGSLLKFASLPNITGFEPYLADLPTGQSPEFEFDGAGTSTFGNATLRVLDKKIGTDNAERWLSGFFGNDDAVFDLHNKKVFVEVFDGTTWTPHMVGAITSITQASKLEFEISITDAGALLKQRIFTSKPRVSYAVFKSVWPLGLLDTLSSTSGSNTDQITGGIGFTVGSFTSIDSGSKYANLTNEALLFSENYYPVAGDKHGSGLFSYAATTGVAVKASPLRAQITVGGTEYHYQVQRLVRPIGMTQATNIAPVQRVVVRELATDDPDYAPLSALTGTGNIIVYRVLNDDGSGIGTMWLPRTPYQILRDILDGHYFELDAMSIPYDAASITALEAAQPLPNTIYRISESTDVQTWLTDFCASYGIGYTIEATSTPASQLRFFSTLAPSSLSGLATIGATDVVAGAQFGWEAGQRIRGAVGAFYTETSRNLSRDSVGTSLAPDMELTIESVNGVTLVGDAAGTDALPQLDFKGLRAISNNVQTLEDDAAVENLISYKYFYGQALKWVTSYYNRRSHGNPTVRLTLARNSNTNALAVGSYALVDVDFLPNQSTNSRMDGDARVMQILQKSLEGMNYSVKLIDAGISDLMHDPNVSALTPSSHTVAFTVTVDEPALVEVQYCAYAAGGSVPGTNSTAWTTAYVSELNTETKAFSIGGLPNGRRIAVRARSTAPATGALKLPSNWDVTTGVLLDYIDPPDNIAADDITSRSAVITWDNTNTSYNVQLWVASPAGTPTQQIVTLPAGSTKYWLIGLHKYPSTSIRVGVRYVDENGGFSDFDTIDFTASGTPAQLDEPSALQIYVGA